MTPLPDDITTAPGVITMLALSITLWTVWALVILHERRHK